MSFTQDIFGTFVELLITVIIINLFNQEYFKKKFKLTLSISFISLIVALLDLLELPFTSILNYIIMFLGIYIATKRNVFNALFEVIFASALLTIMEYIVAVIFYKMLGLESLAFSYRCIQLIIIIAICGVISLNRKIQKKVQFFYEKYQEECYFIAITIFCFSAIELYLWKSNDEVVLGQAAIISVYTAILFSLCLFLLKKLIENKRQKENIRLHEQYMETTENLLDGLYSEKHDFNKHLQAILGICQLEESRQEAIRDIQQYIETFQEKALHKKKGPISFNTGNGVVNALLYSKAKEAEKREVQFFYVPSGMFPAFACEQYELVQIIGNLLDNAFEYVEGLEKEQRIVVLFIGEKENKNQIEVRNTYCEANNRTVSISQNSKLGERHGYGLKIVRSIASKYHGKLSIYQEENEFVVEVLF